MRVCERYCWAVTSILFMALLAIGCSTEPETPTTVVQGSFSVADSIDSSGDFSGISLTIIKKDSANADADTLFNAVTDSSGTLSGVAQVPDKKMYRGLVDRNNKRIGEIQVVLAENDTVSISAILPDVSGTVNIESNEHKALSVLQNVNRNFARVRRFAMAGSIPQDSINGLLNTWSDIYWEVYTDYEGTLASRVAANESIRLLSRRNNELMMKRIRTIQDNDDMVNTAFTYGTDYLAAQRGLDYAAAWLDTLSNITGDKSKRQQVDRKKIKLLYDSARVERALEELSDFKSSYKGTEAMDWAGAMETDLDHFAKGDTIPSFSFTLGNRMISRDSLLGRPYILEITRLTNSLYQEQFSRTTVIYNLYQRVDLEVITLPLDESQVTIDGFFEERNRLWPVARARSFDRKDLLERFNIRFVPTRFLVDHEGKIVRKYVGREFEDIIKGLQSVIKSEDQPS